MKKFKNFLDVFLGLAALAAVAVLVLLAFNNNFSFMSFDVLDQIVFYALPIITALVALRFVCDKGVVWFVLAVIIIALAMVIYFNQEWFFEFIASIFPG